MFMNRRLVAIVSTIAAFAVVATSGAALMLGSMPTSPEPVIEAPAPISGNVQ